MTARTVTLLLLSFAALGTTAALLPFALRLNFDSPLVMVALSLLCMTVALFAGRHSLLPRAMTESSRTALAVTTAIVLISWAAAALASTLVRLVIGTALSGVTSIGVLWLVALWLAVGRLHHWHDKQKRPRFSQLD